MKTMKLAAAAVALFTASLRPSTQTLTDRLSGWS